MVTFALYTALQPDHLLKPSVAFVALSLIDLLKEPLTEMPRSISFLIMVCIRLNIFRLFFYKNHFSVYLFPLVFYNSSPRACRRSSISLVFHAQTMISQCLNCSHLTM